MERPCRARLVRQFPEAAGPAGTRRPCAAAALHGHALGTQDPLWRAVDRCAGPGPGPAAAGQGPRPCARLTDGRRFSALENVSTRFHDAANGVADSGMASRDEALLPNITNATGNLRHAPP